MAPTVVVCSYAQSRWLFLIIFNWYYTLCISLYNYYYTRTSLFIYYNIHIYNVILCRYVVCTGLVKFMYVYIYAQQAPDCSIPLQCCSRCTHIDFCALILTLRILHYILNSVVRIHAYYRSRASKGTIKKKHLIFHISIVHI